MSTAARALAFASRWFDDATVRHTFEPLIADWQRELVGTSGIARWWIVASGLWAFIVTITLCLVTGGSAMPRGALIKALAVLVLSTVTLLTIQIGLNATAFKYDFPLEMRLWMALPMILPLAIPLAMLPMMMLIRGAGRISTGGAAVVVCIGALLAYGTAGWLTPLMQGDVRDELHEAIEQRTAASEQSGEVFYPWTAVRQAKPTTPEQRAAQRAEWRRSPYYIEAQADLTRPQWGRATILTAALAIAMGVLGWALGALRPANAIQASAWWALAWIALMMLDRRFVLPGGPVSPYIPRAPYWMPLAVFTIAAVAISIATRHRRLGTEAP